VEQQPRQRSQAGGGSIVVVSFLTDVAFGGVGLEVCELRAVVVVGFSFGAKVPPVSPQYTLF